tara:strand:- start:129 stop:365 length:237 start_codon:yes stop_codon:yes gene_type:complete
MSRKKKLIELKCKLLKLKKERNKEMPKRINENGIVDMEVISNIQLINTDIYLLEKKINFLEKGKSFLGTAFGGVEIIK